MKKNKFLNKKNLADYIGEILTLRFKDSAGVPHTWVVKIIDFNGKNLTFRQLDSFKVPIMRKVNLKRIIEVSLPIKETE